MEDRMNYDVTVLPEGVTPYQFQVAGHTETNSIGYALLRHPTKPVLYKWLQDRSRGVREKTFYELVYSTNAPDSLKELRPFIPRYHGIYRCQASESLYIGLSDAFAAFRRPNICDLTMGTVSCRPNCCKDKQLREEFKYAWRRTIGFLISGIQIYDPAKEVYVKFTRQVCRSLTPDEVYEKAILPFLGFNSEHRIRLAAAYLSKLNTLFHWIECHGFSSVTFCRTSLLLGHESIVSDSFEVVVCLIDFTDWAEISPTASEQSDNSPETELITGLAHGISVLMGMMTRAIRSHAAGEN